MFRTVFAAFALVAATQAGAQERPALADLSSIEQDAATKVMTLATPHLAQMEGVGPQHVASLVERLAAWKPQIVTLERLPAHEIAILRADPASADLLEAYVGDHAAISDAAQAVLGITDVSAENEMARWSGSPAEQTTQERRRRMLTALAAYEMETALLYWRALGRPAETDEGFTAASLAAMQRFDTSMNERVSVGVALVERLGLPRLWSVDSHFGDVLFPTFADDLQQGFDDLGGAQAAILDGEPYASYNAVERQAIEQGDLAPVYRLMNSESYNTGDVRGQWDIYNREAFPGDAGRKRLALWDERNMRIAANIRHATTTAPGANVLFIVGSAHKPFIDPLMGATLDVRVVHFGDLGTD